MANVLREPADKLPAQTLVANSSRIVVLLVEFCYGNIGAQQISILFYWCWVLVEVGASHTFLKCEL
jgi:hypothetical protein